MTDENKSKWQLLRGDGSTKPIPTDKFKTLKDEFDQMAKDAGKSVNDRRALAEDTRFCRWSGQSPDGRKHAEALDGEKPFPFEGASDARVRTADGIGQEQVIVLMASLMRMQIGVNGTEGTDMEISADVNVLWRWLEKNQLGAEWFVENTKLAQYRQNDSPAVGIMQVWWHEEKALKPVEITPELVVQKAMEYAASQKMEVTPEEATDLQDLLANVARTDELGGLLVALWPELPQASAKTAAGELQADGKTTIAYPYTCENRLRVKARRLFDDIFVPENTGDLQRARVIFVREWFTEPELREKDAKGEFKPGFLTEVLKHEGVSGWKNFSHIDAAGDYSSTVLERTVDKDEQRGHYELITAFFRASNNLGIPGIYSVVYHHNVETPGTDQTLFDSPKGRYPFFPNPREILTDKLWETRGLSELSATEQSALKQLHDSFMDHVQLVTIPPVEVPANRPKMALVWQPLSQIKTMRSGEIKPIVLGQYPVANDKVTANIEARLARYFGLMTATNTPDWVRLYQNHLTLSYFVHMAEVVRYGLALAWKYLPNETLSRVLGHQVTESGDDALEYDVQITFEAGMLNLEFLKTVGEMISQYVLTWDTQGTVQRDKLVRWFFSALSPTLAAELTVPVEVANQHEIEDEQKCFTMIAAGIEPPMITQGQNYQLRLQTEMDIGKKNPEAWDKLTPKSREILEQRLKFLEQQVTQQQNADIGRTGARPALEPAPAAAAVAGA